MYFASFNALWAEAWSCIHSGQTQDACAVPAIGLQKKIQTNVENFTLTAKLNAISENLSFLLRACVSNEVTGIHKFYRREILFIGTLYVSFSYELRAHKSLSCFKVQGSEKPEVTLFFAFGRCEGRVLVRAVDFRAKNLRVSGSNRIVFSS